MRIYVELDLGFTDLFKQAYISYLINVTRILLPLPLNYHGIMWRFLGFSQTYFFEFLKTPIFKFGRFSIPLSTLIIQHYSQLIAGPQKS